MSGGVQGTLARVQSERMGPRCLYPWMDPLDPPTGTDDQTEDGGLRTTGGARRDRPCPAQNPKLFRALL